MLWLNKFNEVSKLIVMSVRKNLTTRYGGNLQVGKSGHKHTWEIDITTRKLTDRDFRELDAFVDALEGRYGTFLYPYPRPRMRASENLTVAVDALKGTKQILITGLPANLTDAVVAGDFIKPLGHSKCYKIAFTENADASGNLTMTVIPELFETVTVGEVFSDAVFTLRQRSDKITLPMDAAKLHERYTLRCEDA